MFTRTCRRSSRRPVRACCREADLVRGWLHWKRSKRKVSRKGGKIAKNSLRGWRALRELRINHKLQQIAVGVPHVDAGSSLLAAARPRHRAFFDLRSRSVEHSPESRGRAFPHEAQIAARWRRRRS